MIYNSELFGGDAYEILFKNSFLLSKAPEIYIRILKIHINSMIQPTLSKSNVPFNTFS